jgi:ABC-type antimicrobial peptide transport system permease subunit
MTMTTFRLAARSVRRNPGRAALMGLAFIIGVISITLTVATGEGARRAVERSFKSMVGALDVLFVQPGGPAQRGMANLQTSVATLSLDDAAAIAREVPNVSAVGAQQSDLAAPIESGGHNGTTALFGSTPNWMAIRGDSITDGVFFDSLADAAMARVAVIGSDIARDYFPGARAVGQHVRLRGVEFEVIGVLAPNGAGPGGISIDNLVYIPLSTSRRRVFNQESLSMLSVKLVDRQRWSQTETAVETLMRARHGKRGRDLDDFRVSSPEAMISRVASVDSTLRRALLWVGVLALLIGGIVVANLMFAGIRSRLREIATWRSVGASRRDVLRQLWCEAVIVSILAAAVGAGIAVALVESGARVMRMPIAISWSVTIGTILITICVGALAGYLPARRASAMSPAVALRDAG